MTYVRLVLAAGLLMLCIVGIKPADAADNSFKTVETASAEELTGAMSRRFVRGIANAAFGLGEFPKQIYEVSIEKGAVLGMTVGPIQGIGMTLLRTACGVAEVLTFFHPFPGFYDMYIEPEFVWQLK